jgi:hypothetical protein
MKYLIPSLLIILSAGVFFGYVNPTYAKIKERRAELARYQEAINSSQELYNLS